MPLQGCHQSWIILRCQFFIHCAALNIIQKIIFLFRQCLRAGCGITIGRRVCRNHLIIISSPLGLVSVFCWECFIMFRIIFCSVLTSVSLFSLTSGELFAADTQCLQATYADVLQTNSGNGRVWFGYNAGVSNNPDNILNTPRISNNNGSTVSTCEAEHCVASGQPVASLALPNFKTSNSNIELTVPWNAQKTFGADDTREYKKIRISSQATLTVAEANHHAEDEYIINSLRVGYKGTLNLRAGTYWIKKFSLGSEARLNVIGEGTVRIISQQPLSVGWRAQLNVVTGTVLDNASKLLIVNEHKIHFASESSVNAILYSQGKIYFGYSANFMGVAVGRRIVLGAEAHAVYQAPQGSADFGPICPGDALEPPTVTITSPEDGDFINDNSPTIEITYSSEGSIDTDSVEITLNNNPLDANCTANETDAQCVPNSAMPDAQVSPDFDTYFS